MGMMSSKAPRTRLVMGILIAVMRTCLDINNSLIFELPVSGKYFMPDMIMRNCDHREISLFQQPSGNIAGSITIKSGRWFIEEQDSGFEQESLNK